MADLFTPTPDEQANLDAAGNVASNARGNLALEQGMYARDKADFDPTGPESTMGPEPTFNQPTPQDHMNDVMKVAPLFMALGALGGAFAHQSGLTMLSSTNAMMKGMVQGNADAYAQARDKYEQQLADFKQKQKTWMDVYRAYQTAYKGRVDADIRAVASANTAVGIADKDLMAAHADVAKRVQLTALIEKNNQQATHWSNEDIQSAIRAEVQKQNANTNQDKAKTGQQNADTRKAASGGGASDSDTQQTVALGKELLAQLKSGDTGTFGGTGFGGMLSRGKEYVDTKIEGDKASRPATQLATKADLFTEKMTAALKVKGQRMDAGDRIIIRDAIDIIKSKGVSDPIAKDKIEEALRVLQKQSGPTKTIGGKTYVQRDGKWFEQ